MNLPKPRLHVVPLVGHTQISELRPRNLGVDASAEIEVIRAGIEQLMARQAGVVPEDFTILTWAWPNSHEIPSEDALRSAIDSLLLTGGLRRVYLGKEPHLTFSPLATPTTPPSSADQRYSMQVPKRQVSEHLPAQDAVAAPDTTPWSLSAPAFELQVEMDVEHERTLLFRVLTTVSFVGLLVLFREFTLVMLGL